MIEKKLRINLSGLWDNPNGFFTLRYQDLNEEKKTQLATRIKLIAPQRTIRKVDGISIEDIKLTLTEINPIIFSEQQTTENGYRSSRRINSYRRFNTLSSRTLDSYRFKDLCQAIYKINCLKKNLTNGEIYTIANLSTQLHDSVTRYLEPRLRSNNPTEEEERISLISDIGIEDIRHAREQAESRGADNIPDGMYDSGNLINQNIDDRFDPFDITEDEINRRIALGVNLGENTIPQTLPRIVEWHPPTPDETIPRIQTISRERIEHYRTDIERIREIPIMPEFNSFFAEDEQETIDQLVED
jgi:hypothetical protein